MQIHRYKYNNKKYKWQIHDKNTERQIHKYSVEVWLSLAPNLRIPLIILEDPSLVSNQGRKDIFIEMLRDLVEVTQPPRGFLVFNCTMYTATACLHAKLGVWTVTDFKSRPATAGWVLINVLCIICVMLITIVIHVSFVCVAHMWQSGGYPMPVRGGMVLNNRVCPNWMGADHMSVGTLGDDHGPVDGNLPASVSNTCNTATVAWLSNPLESLGWIVESLGSSTGNRPRWSSNPTEWFDNYHCRQQPEHPRFSNGELLHIPQFPTTSAHCSCHPDQPQPHPPVVFITMLNQHRWFPNCHFIILIPISAYHEHFLQILWEDLALLLIIDILLQTSF